MATAWPDSISGQSNKAALHPASLVQPDAGNQTAPLMYQNAYILISDGYCVLTHLQEDT
jgi:hypothetical protein